MSSTDGAEIFQGFVHTTVNTGGDGIDCLIGGDGPPVLLLHGFPQGKAVWAKVAPMLAKNFTSIGADPRSCCDSLKPVFSPDRSTYSFAPR